MDNKETHPIDKMGPAKSVVEHTVVHGPKPEVLKVPVYCPNCSQKHEGDFYVDQPVRCFNCSQKVKLVK